jgi:hypothetical protein
MPSNLLDKLQLSQRDKQSDTWCLLLPYFESRLQAVREQNDGGHSAEVTSNLRGQIAVWKELIDLDKDAVMIESTNL